MSVLGVFHDGRMSEEAWSLLAPKVSSSLGACGAGYGPSLRDEQPELAKWVDGSTRENGISDELLERVAPHARADLVMVLMVYRHIPESRSRDGGAPRAPQTPPPGADRRGRYGSAVMVRGPREDDGDSRVFELSASLYSVREHHLVAEIDLRDAGDDLDEAMGAFSEKLRGVLPDATCGSWQWKESDDVH